MIDPTTPKGSIISAALRWAAQRPWHEISLIEISEAAGVSLVDLRKEFGSKAAIVSAFMRAIDDTVLMRATKPLNGTAPLWRSRARRSRGTSSVAPNTPDGDAGRGGVTPAPAVGSAM